MLGQAVVMRPAVLVSNLTRWPVPRLHRMKSGIIARAILMADTAKRIIVLGAGVVGVTTAYKLAIDGHDVPVIDARRRCGDDE